MSEFAIKTADNKSRIYTPYNKNFVDRIKLMGGKWDSTARCWTINANALEDVRAAMRDIYGRDDREPTETVTVELRFGKAVSEWHAPVTLLGRTIASASGRDSGARIGDEVMFTVGAPISSGSVKNWYTEVPSGCTVKMFELPKSIIDAGYKLPEGVTLNVLGDNVDTAALAEEKARLEKRIAEIDAILAGAAK